MNPTDSNGNMPTGAQTPGGMLRAAREAKGLHLGLLSVTLKVPVRQLEALENDQYDAFRGPAFVRAVAQAMCRHLGIDPAPVLAGLPQAASSMGGRPAAPVHAGKIRPATVHMHRARRGLALSRQVLMLAALMLIGTVAFVWWPMPAARNPAETGETWPAAGTASEAAGEDTPVSINVPSEPVTATAADNAASAASVAPPAAVASAPVLAPPASAAPASAENGLLIQASGDTWLEVRDGRGQLVVNRLLRQGESQSVDLAPPFNVVIGRAHLVRTTWRGKDFDLTPHTKVSTARFDIQP